MNLKVTSIFFFLLILMVVNSARAWDIDWSRRQKRDPAAVTSGSAGQMGTTSDSSGSTVKDQTVVPASGSGTVVAGEPQNPTEPAVKKKYLEGLVQTTHQPWTGDRQEFVILNTGKGFIPNNVRLHKGLHYVVHIVNVNEDKKNVSFMLDAFDQHYATYYGQIRSFNLDPEKEGVFDYQCPETNSSGKLIVFGQGSMPPARTITSDH